MTAAGRKVGGGLEWERRRVGDALARVLRRRHPGYDVRVTDRAHEGLAVADKPNIDAGGKRRPPGRAA